MVLRLRHQVALQERYDFVHVQRLFEALEMYRKGEGILLGRGSFASVYADHANYMESRLACPFYTGHSRLLPTDDPQVEIPSGPCVLKAICAANDQVETRLGRPFKSLGRALQVLDRMILYNNLLVQDGIGSYPILAAAIMEVVGRYSIFTLNARVRGQDDRSAMLDSVNPEDPVILLADSLLMLEECAIANSRRLRKGMIRFGVDTNTPANFARGKIDDFDPGYLWRGRGRGYIEPGGTEQEKSWRAQRIYTRIGQMISLAAGYVETVPGQWHRIMAMIREYCLKREKEDPSLYSFASEGGRFLFDEDGRARKRMLTPVGIAELLEASYVQARLLILLCLAEEYPERVPFLEAFDLFRPWLTTHSKVPISTMERGIGCAQMFADLGIS